jgi:hypothetical protein
MRSAHLAIAVFFAACTARRFPRDHDAAVPTPTSKHIPSKAPIDASARGAPLDPLHDVWHAPELVSAAVSNALATPDGGAPIAVAADVLPDHARATLRIVHWSARGVTESARTVVSGMPPGAAIALSRRPGGYVAVWFVNDGDGGVQARAIELDDVRFTSGERAATEAEALAADWARTANLFRRRQGVREMAPPVRDGDVTAHVEFRRPRATVALVVGSLLVTQGDDLLGFEPSIGLAVVSDTRRWVAASRGHCRETRVEVFLVEGERVSTRGRFLFGTETGVRWIRLDATADEAVVSWYQSLIPLRIDCIRGRNGATLDDHGVRVARVRAEGPALRPLPTASALSEGTPSQDADASALSEGTPSQDADASTDG